MVEHHEGDTRVRCKRHIRQHAACNYLVIQDIDEVCIEGMKVIQLREFGENQGQLLAEVRLCEFHLPHVEAPDPGDLVVPMDHRWCLPLSFGQDDVREVLCSGDHSDLLEIVKGHVGRDPSTALQ